jgi:hypothetical protein
MKTPSDTAAFNTLLDEAACILSNKAFSINPPHPLNPTPSTPPHPSQIDPLAPKPRALDLLQLSRALQQSERDVAQAVRDSEWESREVARVRAGQEQGIALEVPYWDVARGKVGVFFWGRGAVRPPGFESMRVG